MVVPLEDGSGYTKENIRVDKPARTIETTTEEINLLKLKNSFDSLRDQNDTLRENKVGESNGGISIMKGADVNDLTEVDSDSEVEVACLNRTPKQSEVRHVVNESRLSVCVILKSHVDINSLSKLLHDNGNLHKRVNRLRVELDEVQKALDLNQSDHILREEEVIYVQAFNAAKLDEERFLKQKAKIEWLEKVSDDSCSNMILPITDVEIKAAMFDIGDDRAPGPDGFSLAFFKKDDLFIFARGDLDSARVIIESLDEFKNTSGLVSSLAKSMVFFCNVSYHIKVVILDIMPFTEGDLPVKYLGVPLISSRLLNKDCKVLVEKAKNRIEDWKNKSLSFAGRLQLCKSVISSMHVYWASVLIIPKGIIYNIQILISGFLWCNGEYKRGKAKPQAWIVKAPVLNLILAPNLDVGSHDNIHWRDLNGVVSDFSPLANKKSARSIFGKLILAACSYFIRLERNNRLFKNVKRMLEELRDAIMVTVHLRLLSF
ncbi:hypothetical protein Tco_0299353 [Tanacetum coccineum]